jgi:hypothetical protein
VQVSVYTRNALLPADMLTGPRQKLIDAAVSFDEIVALDVIEGGFDVVEAGFDVTELVIRSVLLVYMTAATQAA